MENIKEKLIEISNSKNSDLKKLISVEIIECINSSIKPNIQQLASKCFTAKSSITNFCKSLGFSGFKEFIEILWIEESQYVPKVNSDFKKEKNHFEDFKETLLNCLTQFDSLVEEIIFIAEEIVKSKRIFIFSSNYLSGICSSFSNYLQVFNKEVYYSNEGFASKIFTRNIKEDDLCIFFSTGLNNLTLYNIFNRVKETSSNIITITTRSQRQNFTSAKMSLIIDIPTDLMREQIKKTMFAYIVNQIINSINSLDPSVAMEINSPKMRF